MKVKVLFGFLLSFLMLNGNESTCPYSQNLETGIIEVYNPGFPDKYEGANQCTRKITSHYVIKINCSINMPVFVDGCQDSLSIQFTNCEENILEYCGRGRMFLEGKNPIIKFDSPPSSQGGKFFCQIQAKNSFDENNCKCGWKKVTKIVGGTETGVNEYPMMCGFVDFEQKIIYCGCTIISRRYVLTAAHCIDLKDITKIGVVVGEHDVTTGSETNATKLFRVKNCTIHPNYSKTNEYENDIAVCKIIGALNYSAEVGPVCLPFHHTQDTFENDNVTALGWGLLEFAGAKSTTLQKVKLNVISLARCKSHYPELTKSNMCTYTPGKDTCQMDSGGPILWQDPTTHRLVLIGITSSGIGCASDKPAVATRVGDFIDWIESATPAEQYCMAE